MSTDDRTESAPSWQIDPESPGKILCPCEECGGSISCRHSKPRRFCSTACRTAYRGRTGEGIRRRNGQVLTCPWCRGEFYISPCEAGRRTHCSRSCAARAGFEASKGRCPICKGDSPVGGQFGRFCSWECYRTSQQPRSDDRSCRICGQPLTEKSLRYCSHACRDEARRTGAEKPCETCGEILYVQPYQTNKRYCSRACQNQAKRIDGPGAKVKRKDGYVQVYYPSHPDSTKSGWVLEHRLVAEQKYGRRILPTEHVHHLNGQRDDNRPENLEIIAPGTHALISNAEGVRKRLNLKQRLAEYERLYGPLADPD